MSEPVEDGELSAGQTAYRKRIADRKAKREAGFLKERMTTPAEHKDGSDEELIKSEVFNPRASIPPCSAADPLPLADSGFLSIACSLPSPPIGLCRSLISHTHSLILSLSLLLPLAPVSLSACYSI